MVQCEPPGPCRQESKNIHTECWMCGLVFCTLRVFTNILSAGPIRWNFMRVAMLDNFFNRFHPCGGTYPCGRVTPWVGDDMCTSKSGVYIIYYVRGTALGLLAVPTKLGNPGGWEYRRVFLYSHGPEKLASKYFLVKSVFRENIFETF